MPKRRADSNPFIQKEAKESGSESESEDEDTWLQKTIGKLYLLSSRAECLVRYR